MEDSLDNKHTKENTKKDTPHTSHPNISAFFITLKNSKKPD